MMSKGKRKIRMMRRMGPIEFLVWDLNLPAQRLPKPVNSSQRLKPRP